MAIRYHILTIIWSIILLSLTFLPGKELPDTAELISFDKIVHVALFALLSILMLVGIVKHQISKKKFFNPLAIVVGYTAILGILIEICQKSIGRSFDWFDWLADMVGCLVGLVVFKLLYKYKISYQYL